jgi:hypothetical protein
MQDFSIYITAGSWFTKFVEVEAVDRLEAFRLAHTENPFPVAATFGRSDEPFEVDISDVSEMSAEIEQIRDGRWGVELVAQLQGAGTFMKAYADAEEAMRDGVELFPGWPEEIEGWQFRAQEIPEVEEVSPRLKTGAQLKDSAIAILENLYPEIEIALYRSGGYASETLEGAREAIEALQKAVLDEGKAVNPRYHCKAELAAELVYFAHTHPEHFAQVFQESDMTWHRGMDARTPQGIFQLWSFYSQISDDHSYSLDMSGAIPLLKGDWQFGTFKSLAGPSDIIAALQGYRKSVEQELEIQVVPSL